MVTPLMGEHKKKMWAIRDYPTVDTLRLTLGLGVRPDRARLKCSQAQSQTPQAHGLDRGGAVPRWAARW